MNIKVLGFIMLVWAATLYGCSTMKGIGEDLSTVGGWVTKSSTEVEKGM